jgi:eukaryotic-like serine/threonine-protein kinase
MSNVTQSGDWGGLSADMDALLDLDAADRSSRLAGIAAIDAARAERLSAWLQAIEQSEGLWQNPQAPMDTVHVGPWRSLHRIGRGGMGDVYLAERADGAFEKFVALKLLREDRRGNSSSIERERVLLARLRHPGIAQLLDGGVHDNGRQWLVTEWVEGQRLDQWLSKTQPDLRQRLRMLQSIAAAVAYAHTHLIVHRDLKPANIIVDSEGMPRLLDFGIARLLDAGGMTSDTVDRSMTPAFAAPEQLLGQTITTRTDVYALGGLLYWLIAEAPPHDAENLPVADWVERVCEQLPEAASRRAQITGVDANLDAIVGKAMMIEPAARYASVDALIHDLDAWQRGEPVSARPPTRIEQGWRFLHRNTLPVSLTAALILALSAGLATTLWQAQQARQALVLVESERATALSELERNQALREGMMAAFLDAGGDVTGPANFWLDRIAKQVANPAIGDADTRARLLTQLAQLETDRAQPERARALYEQLLGTKAVALASDTEARARCGLANALSNMGEPEAALREYQRGLAQAERLRGAARMTLVFCLQSMLIRSDNTDPGAALASLQRAMRELDQLGNSYAVRVLRANTLHNQGTVLEAAGRFDEANARYREAIALDSALGRGETMSSATTLAAIAASEMMRGDLRNADRDFSEALALSERVGGMSRPLAIDLANHAVVKGWLDQHAEAEHLARRALQVLDALGDSQNSTRGNAEAELGKALMHQGDYANALAALDRSERANAAAFGADHDRAFFPVVGRAKTLAAMGNLEAALATIEVALTHFRHAESSASVMACLSVLASIHRDAGRLDAAHAAASEALQIQRSLSDAGHWRVAAFEIELADIESRRGQHAAARALAEHAHPILLRVLGAEHTRTRIAAGLLGE